MSFPLVAVLSLGLLNPYGSGSVLGSDPSTPTATPRKSRKKTKRPVTLVMQKFDKMRSKLLELKGHGRLWNGKSKRRVGYHLLSWYRKDANDKLVECDTEAEGSYFILPPLAVYFPMPSPPLHFLLSMHVFPLPLFTAPCHFYGIERRVRYGILYKKSSCCA